jgi:hypothetical protein
MRNLALLVGSLVLAASLGAAPAGACMNCVGGPTFVPPGYPAPWSPPVVYVPSPYYYPYYAPPAFYLGSGYDPDYRDIRYNRYFQRYQAPPQIRGYTLR